MKNMINYTWCPGPSDADRPKYREAHIKYREHYDEVFGNTANHIMDLILEEIQERMKNENSSRGIRS